MATAAELLVPLRPGLLPVPAGGAQGVCRFCHSGCDARFAQCYQCQEADQSIGAVEILPISLSIDGEMFHYHLRNYKDGRPQIRARTTQRLAALTAVFLRHHGDCIGSYDTVTSVPSPTRTAMNSVLSLIPSVRTVYRPALQASGLGAKDELRPDRFELIRDVKGERILVIDDTFTRGPTMFSAAAALRSAGAMIVGPVVLGRHVRPGWEPSRQLLSWLRPRAWDETRCCRCDGERADSSHALF